MKKGFTLIELLAVIIILALLMIVAVPNVLSTLNSTKKSTFVTQAQSIYKTAQQQWTKDTMLGNVKESYDDTNNKLDLSKLGSNVKYCVKVSTSGTVEKVVIDDGTYHIETTGGVDSLKSESITSSTGTVDCGAVTKPQYKDSVLATAPDLGDLIPIKYNGTNWVYADTTEEWYDYADREWANAVVLSSGVTKEVNDTISEDEIDLWFVWVPRYEYKLPADSIGTTGTPKAIDIRFISSAQTTPSEGYSFHPGFAWDSNWADGISEWKSGLWIGKFESSAAIVGQDKDEENVYYANTPQTVKIKANVTPWRNVQYSNIYTSALNIDSLYTLSNMDSHQTRYTEWTTMSYLSNSIFGRCLSKTECSEIALNIISGKTNALDETSYLTGGGNYKTNVNQSTTGNIYGIYDVNGGSWEYTMGYLKNATGLYTKSGFDTSNIPSNNKYTDILDSNEFDTAYFDVIKSINGISSFNGVFVELLNNRSGYTWYGDHLNFVNNDYPWFECGGDWYYGETAGAFSSNDNDAIAYPRNGFRVALVNN